MSGEERNLFRGDRGLQIARTAVIRVAFQCFNIETAITMDFEREGAPIWTLSLGTRPVRRHHRIYFADPLRKCRTDASSDKTRRGLSSTMAPLALSLRRPTEIGCRGGRDARTPVRVVRPDTHARKTHVKATLQLLRERTRVHAAADRAEPGRSSSSAAPDGAAVGGADAVNALTDQLRLLETERDEAVKTGEQSGGV